MPFSPRTIASAVFSALWLPGGFLPFEHTFSTNLWAACPCARVSVLGGDMVRMHQLRRDSCDWLGATGVLRVEGPGIRCSAPATHLAAGRVHCLVIASVLVWAALLPVPSLAMWLGPGRCKLPHPKVAYPGDGSPDAACPAW
jgi:hypothetical protein